MSEKWRAVGRGLVGWIPALAWGLLILLFSDPIAYWLASFVGRTVAIGVLFVVVLLPFVTILAVGLRLGDRLLPPVNL